MTELVHKRRAIIVDLDGSLARISPFRNPFDAHLCGLDEVNRAVALVISWAVQNDRDVILVSGRGFKEGHRYYTEQWLFWNEIPYTRLFTRQVGDARKDFIVKKEIYERDIAPFYIIDFVMDDRRTVVEMWRELGLEVFQLEDRID